MDMQGVVLAGGEGIRLRPSTFAVNKHLLPVYDQPMVSYPIRQMVQAGVTDIVVVTGRAHLSAFEQVLDDGEALGCTRLRYAAQENSGGIAHALLAAESSITAKHIWVMLGDNLFGSPLSPYARGFAAGSCDALVLLKALPETQLKGLGVAVMDGDRLLRIEEKPDTPTSNLIATGAYFYRADVFDRVRTLAPSDRGELEITSLNNDYLARGVAESVQITGWWADAGTHEGLYRAATLVRAEQVNNTPPDTDA